MGKAGKGNSLGISLILVIFIILCLITFGTLSFMLANNDNNLSISAAENIIEFYDADMVAQESLQGIDALLRELYIDGISEETYVNSVKEALLAMELEATVDVETGEITFQTTVSDKEVLVSVLEITYPADGGYYRIISWGLENHAEYN